jgi:hypothetical protein
MDFERERYADRRYKNKIGMGEEKDVQLGKK